ncbi:DUF2786 domain-containing protein [Bacillus haynesii]|uniref:DUF2786 domain-containing protein n=1 Tax=Bacillus TaxID=1386 RepID=UPI0022810096|nr:MULTISPECIES: DUF2786 domain-containing protein [Bacillus]MCY7968575.1 DUF2786 domain-containing protein [Bacillus haynesii]MCY8103032.1 DUF2786 domain-containing protein [Bacillus haynesii]MCY8152773.1 DUF2786 domain-containing protein [Bacillus paralicheniformis]MCY8665222.1 DUF2786 domain-containing protein [Bacillus haynesii]MEC1343800.1 DUF2786 domain-containing protein [Bacillus haynesii]
MKQARNESIIKRIKGLLAIANDNRNDEESQSAFLMAQKLMMKYDISAGDVTDKSEKEEIAKGQATAYKKLFWWERTLAGIIAANFKVEFYYNNRVLNGDRRKKSTIIFFGYESDVQLAKEMYVLAYDAVVIYANRFVNEYYSVNFVRRSIKKTRDLKKSYITGFLEGLKQKFNEQVSQMKEEYGLMIIKPKEVTEAYKELSKTFGKAHKLRIPDIEEFAAFHRGHQDGNSIDYTKSTINDDVLTF